MCSGTVVRAGVGNTPDRAAGIVSDQQRSILGDRKRGRASPYFCAPLTGDPEAGGEILIEAFRSAIFERHAHDLVASRLRPVPRTSKSHERMTFVFGRELVAFTPIISSACKKEGSTDGKGWDDGLRHGSLQSQPMSDWCQGA